MHTRNPLGVVVHSLAVVVLLATAAVADDPPRIPWQPGPVQAALGDIAELRVPAGYVFTGKSGTQKLLELTHNLASGDELGALVPAGDTPDDAWFVTFEFDKVGFVKDDEKATIDADALLKTIREATEHANEERRKKGWGTFHIDGWERAPFYDPATHNLTWAIRGVSDSGDVTINHCVRILGRRGTMNVDLVMSPEHYGIAAARFDSVMRGYAYKTGSRYADFVKGDRVAAVGLSALVLGGAGVAAVKTGLLSKLGGFLFALVLALKKALVLVLIALVALFRRLGGLLKRMLGRNDEVAGQQPPTPVPVEPERDEVEPRT